jgi:hypothetical protein
MLNVGAYMSWVISLYRPIGLVCLENRNIQIQICLVITSTIRLTTI